MPNPTWAERAELANRFAPHLLLFPENQTLPRPGKQTPQMTSVGDYHPRAVELLLEGGSLAAGLWRSRLPPTLENLAACKSVHAQLLLQNKLFPNRDDAWRMYFEILADKDSSGQTGRARFPVTAYARAQTRAESLQAMQGLTNPDEKLDVARDEVGRPFFDVDQARDDDLTLQYWFCYYYDDWVNQHEGDWEGVCLFLRRSEQGYQPAGACYYAHEGGLRRRWQDIERAALGSEHPLVYVAAGSHASYFQYLKGGYFTTITGFIVPVLGLRLNVNINTNPSDYVPSIEQAVMVQPEVQLLGEPQLRQAQKWLDFPGTWGVQFLGKLGHAGPRGPSCKGLKWHHPFAWMERNCKPDVLVY